MGHGQTLNGTRANARRRNSCNSRASDFSPKAPPPHTYTVGREGAGLRFAPPLPLRSAPRPLVGRHAALLFRIASSGPISHHQGPRSERAAPECRQRPLSSPQYRRFRFNAAPALFAGECRAVPKEFIRCLRCNEARRCAPGRRGVQADTTSHKDTASMRPGAERRGITPPSAWCRCIFMLQ